MMEVTVDDKGRIVIPEGLRRRLDIREGSKLRVTVEYNKVMIGRGIPPDEFISHMEGCIKKGSRVKKTDPLKLKEIWLQS